MYEKIRRHSDIRFPPKKIVTTSDKILLLIQVRDPSSKWGHGFLRKLQAILAGLPLNSPEFKPTEGQPYLEAVSIFRHATRIVTGEWSQHMRSFTHCPSAVAEVAIVNQSGALLKHALELQVLHKTLVKFYAAYGLAHRVRCLNAKAWEDRPLVLRQIEHIGEKS